MQMWHHIFSLNISHLFSVQCSQLTVPMNGDMGCRLLMSGLMPSYEDTCTFYCDMGYELTGSDTRICQSNGSWNGSDVMCRRGTVVIDNI